jgi:DNA-binding beta-propeller fold protein YncE
MSRTLRSTLRFALPMTLCAGFALGACNVDRPSISTIDPELPVEPPVDPAVEAPVYTSAKAPPAISGGTLLALKDGVTAVAADPDRDRLCIVDTKKLVMRGAIALKPDDEPGRGVEDGAGRVWIALRRGGAVVTVDVATMAITARTPVCAEPRGVAYDPASDQIHVACASGELVSFAAATGKETRRLHLDRDLRDVLVDGAGLRVSRFHSAELLTIDASGAVAKRARPAAVTDGSARGFDASVAWRTVALPGGGFASLHQRGLTTPVSGASLVPYYSDPCALIVKTAVTVTDTNAAQSPLAGGLPLALAVDIAVAPDGQKIAIAAAGERSVLETDLAAIEADDGLTSCLGAADPTGSKRDQNLGTPIAVAYDPAGQLLVQSEEPPSVWVLGRGAIALTSTESRRDSGHELFHSSPPGGIACASCHPEGREDGRVWQFDGIGARRTQSVAGGVLETGPLHWSADLATFDDLIDEVLVKRMGHEKPGPVHAKAFSRWLDALPAPVASPMVDASAVAKGTALFHDATIGCATCHAGAKLTTGKTADVGTGEHFKIPSLLGVAARAPYMHDGCAATLADRFGKCGGSTHGSTASLTPEQVSDLVAYMETL